MYCQNCGQKQEENAAYCTKCGASLGRSLLPPLPADKPSFGLGIAGFLIPLVGLILYLVHIDKYPRKAKSAGKGALMGVITFAVLTVGSFTFLWLSLYYDGTQYYDDANIASEKAPADYVDVTFGTLKIKDKGYGYYETSLDVTVKNNDENRCTYYITIEAVDSNGARLDTDTVYADKLNPGQEIHLKAFEYIENDKIEKLKKAKVKVLEVEKYDF